MRDMVTVCAIVMYGSVFAPTEVESSPAINGNSAGTED